MEIRDVLLILCLFVYCEAHIHVDDNEFVGESFDTDTKHHTYQIHNADHIYHTEIKDYTIYTDNAVHVYYTDCIGRSKR